MEVSTIPIRVALPPDTPAIRLDAALVATGRAFFAIGLAGLGAEHVVFGEFVTGRTPAWPDALAGQAVFVPLSGIVIVLAALAMLSRRHGRAPAVAVAWLIAAWSLLRHLPVLAGEPLLSGAWTRAGKALVLATGALAVAATLAPRTAAGMDASGARRWNQWWLVAARLSLGAFLVVTGIQHFLFTAFVASLIPGWFPGDAVFWTRAAGVALIASGLGLMVRPTARVSAL